MATTTINASPSQQYILYSESADRYFVSTVSWTKPDAGYTMQSLQLAFTTDYNGGYRVMTNHQVGDGWVIVGTYETYENAGDKLITLPNSYWQNLSSDTLYLRFRRPTDSRQTYNNIRLIMTYTANASASTAAAVDAIAGNPQTVNISNTDSTVTHVVTWQYGSLSGSTFTSLVTSGAQTYGAATRSPAWAVPAASLATLYAANGSRTTIPGRITVETFLEGNSLGSTTVEALLTIPNDNTTKPTLAVSMSAEQDAVGEQAEDLADYIQNHTTLILTPTAAGQAGASVASIRIETPDGVIAATSGTATRILIRTAGSYPVTVIATDSRGYTNVWATTLTVAECAAPVITGIMAERCAQDGTRTDEGAYVAISATARITSLAEASSWTYSIKKSGTSAVIASGSLTNGAGIIGGSLDPEASYTVTVTVEDTLGQTANASTDIGSAIYTIHRMAGGKGIAFGKVSDKFGVEVNEDWPLYAHGMEIMQLVVDAAHPVGSVIQTADADWNPNEAWPWTSWVLLKDVFLRASGSQQALATGGAASASIAQQTLNIPAQNVTLTPANLPIYTLYARKSNGSSVNYNGYETDPVSSMIYRAHTPGSNSGTASDWRYLISNQNAAAVSIPAQSATIPAQSVTTLPPYLVVNTWLRVANPNDTAANNVLSGILGGVSMTGSGSGEGGYSGLMAVFARNIGEMEGEFERNDEEHTAIQGQFENCVKYGDLTEEYSASVIGGRMNGPNLITTQVFWTTNQYNQIVVLGDAARHTWSGHPWVKSIARDKEYTYDTEPSDKGDSYWVTTNDQGVTTYHVYKDEDEVRTSRVDLGASPVVEPSGESYRYALQFAVTAAASSAHNSEDLIFYTGTDGGTATREVDDGNGGTTTETYTYPAYGILDLVDGETYTASCWVRITSGTQARLVFKYGHSYYGYVSGYEGENQNSMEITSAEYGTWKRLEWTFVYHSTDHAGNAGGWKKRVSFGVCRKYTGTVQMCGWRVVHGLNSWLEEQNRQIQAGISALEARVQALEG